jgi:tRNA threonylcarbamoyladenosine biosynthesis protein TsaB
LKEKSLVNLPVILSLETATMGGSVFVGRGPAELAAINGDPQVSQSSSLLSDINTALEDAGLTLQDVDLFACTSGPGSFTGLRIGIATLKALAATLDRPCAGIPTLQAVAHSGGVSTATVALLPAGRGELFAQMFSVSGHQEVTGIDSPAHLSPTRLVEKYGSHMDLIWAGPGAHQQREFLEDSAKRLGVTFAEDSIEVSSLAGNKRGNIWRLAAREPNLARHAGALALRLFNRGKVQSAEAIQAIYVRPSDAELNEQCR